MKFKKMSYYSFGSENYPGVMKKINNTVKAAECLGLNAEHKSYNASDKLRILKDLTKDNSDLIFIRFSFFISTLLFPILILKRFMGTKIVVDVPTPRSIVLNEMRGDDGKNVIMKILWSYFFCSWILFPANLIIQYANESKYFSWGLRSKTIKMGNGILIEGSMKLVPQTKRSGKLNIIAVASFAFWHGYDRLLKAIAEVKQTHPQIELHLTLVGSGNVLPELKKMVDELNINSQVDFTGALYGQELDYIYENMDIGVSSLALYRKGLSEASDLKTREYMAKGLCVMGAGKDPDFNDNSPYRFLVPNDESIALVADMLIKLAYLKLPEPREVREYAEKNLAFEGKLKQILNSL